MSMLSRASWAGFDCVSKALPDVESGSPAAMARYELCACPKAVLQDALDKQEYLATEGRARQAAGRRGLVAVAGRHIPGQS